jgi:serine/threonine protein kinase
LKCGHAEQEHARLRFGEDAITKKIGKYEILSELDRDVMGTLHRGRDSASGLAVAVKLIDPNLAKNPDFLERFYREGRAAGEVQHPNIIGVYEVGKAGRTPYIAYELLEGDDLAHIVASEEGGKNPLPASLKLNYIVQLCRALECVHKRGMVHRDIKPANIFVTTEGTVKLTHFGIARLPGSAPASSGILIGTVEYMSPESIRGEKVDGRADIWAVGGTLYEILTYTKPFQGDSITAVMFAILSQEPKGLRKLRPELPVELESVICRALQKEPTERYQSMAELLTDLEAVNRKMHEPS